jgi:hypothetical protein
LQRTAVSFSKDYVRKFLKFPQDASFPWGEATVKCSPDRTKFFVHSTVKAKNALGVELTYDWATVLEREGDTWDLLTCIVGDEAVYVSPKLEQRKRDKEYEEIRKAEDERRAERKALADAARAKMDALKVMRTWKDTTGTFSVEAQFVYRTPDGIKLRKADGTEVTIPMDKLSAEDQAWINQGKRN